MVTNWGVRNGSSTLPKARHMSLLSARQKDISRRGEETAQENMLGTIPVDNGTTWPPHAPNNACREADAPIGKSRVGNDLENKSQRRLNIAGTGVEFGCGGRKTERFGHEMKVQNSNQSATQKDVASSYVSAGPWGRSVPGKCPCRPPECFPGVR